MITKFLYRADFQPNYPVCEGVIFFLTDMDKEVTEDIVKTVAKELGFNFPSPIRLELLGILEYEDIDFDAEIIDDVEIIHYENGEY